MDKVERANDEKLQLLYWDGGNFGDELNVWLWAKLLPETVDTKTPYQEGSQRPLFVGIGTILGDNLPEGQSKAVFGSGVGYHGLPELNDKLHIYCVRGPLTANALGLDKKFAITDPAILIRVLELEAIDKKYSYSFMPHHTSVDSVDWGDLCGSLGIKYIDPRLDFEETLDKLRASKVVIAEAMHGAIVADALRIPWVAVNFHGATINTFKWEDWCQSLELQYEPHTLGLNKKIRLIKRKLPGILSSFVKKGINVVLARRALKQVLINATPILADISIVENRTERMEYAMQKLIKDVQDGLF